MALPVKMRFRNRRDIRRVLSRGARFVVPLGRVAYVPVSDGRGRILFVISTAAAKRSTERNRLRRQLNGWVLRESGDSLGRYDIVVTLSRVAALAGRVRLLILAEEMRRRLAGAY